MKKAKALNDFSKYSDAKLETFSSYVVTCMTGNGYFTTPTPALADLSKANQQYIAALNAAQGRDQRLVKEKNLARENLLAMLGQLADYVTLIANGNRAIIASAGLIATAETKSSGALGTIGNFSVKLGKNSGEVDLSVDTVDNARYYLFYFAKSGEPLVWDHESDTIPFFTITGLPPLTMFTFRIVAKGTNGQTAETGVITKAVV